MVQHLRAAKRRDILSVTGAGPGRQAKKSAVGGKFGCRHKSEQVPTDVESSEIQKKKKLTRTVTFHEL
jgi:hypothetical protein